MAYQKTKRVELSPKLKLGVGRSYSSTSLLKLSGTVFLVFALALAVQTLIQIAKHKNSPATATNQSQPKVLGASDSTGNNQDALFTTYTVQSGDTVFSIAQSHGNISWSTIATLNNLTPPFKLKIGQKLKLPKP